MLFNGYQFVLPCAKEMALFVANLISRLYQFSVFPYDTPPYLFHSVKGAAYRGYPMPFTFPLVSPTSLNTLRQESYSLPIALQGKKQPKNLQSP